MLRAQKNDDLGSLRIGQRIGEGWHLLSAVLNLISDLGGSPELVFADVGQCRGLLRACAVGAMATGASFVAERIAPAIASAFESAASAG